MHTRRAVKKLTGSSAVAENSHDVRSVLLSRRSESGLVHRCCPSVRLSVCLFSVCLSVAKIQKTRFSQKLSNLELCCLLTPATHRPYDQQNTTTLLQYCSYDREFQLTALSYYRNLLEICPPFVGK